MVNHPEGESYVEQEVIDELAGERSMDEKQKGMLKAPGETPGLTSLFRELRKCIKSPLGWKKAQRQVI
jgi:hypothetical protein